MYAKQNTAKTFLVGPILDADGVAKTDEVVGSVKVTKNGTVGAPNSSSTLTHNHTGHYVYAANAGDFDTLGEVEFSLNSGTNAMAPVRFMVIPANVYDAVIAGSDKLEVDAVEISGDSGAADKLEATLDATESGSVSDSIATAASFVTDLTEATNDHYAGGYLVFYSGVLAKQARRIFSYNGATKAVTLESAFTEAPGDGDAFLILGRGE